MTNLHTLDRIPDRMTDAELIEELNQAHSRLWMALTHISLSQGPASTLAKDARKVVENVTGAVLDRMEGRE